MLILKVVKVLCFDTLSQVFILNGLLAWRFASMDLENLHRETDTVRRFLGRVRKKRMADPKEASPAGCGERAGAPIS